MCYKNMVALNIIGFLPRIFATDRLIDGAPRAAEDSRSCRRA